MTEPLFKIILYTNAKELFMAKSYGSSQYREVINLLLKHRVEAVREAQAYPPNVTEAMVTNLLLSEVLLELRALNAKIQPPPPMPVQAPPSVSKGAVISKGKG